MSGNVKVLLIGGTSHVGKSTISKHLAKSLGWNYLSTDQLARHPGRPWRADGTALPQDVVDHYATCSADELVDSVLAHYRANVGPIVRALVRSHLNNTFEPCLVLEGSAILPEVVADLDTQRTRRVWLTAPDATITARIYAESNCEHLDSQSRALVESFLGRTLAFNQVLLRSVATLGEIPYDATTPNIESLLRQICIHAAQEEATHD